MVAIAVPPFTFEIPEGYYVGLKYEIDIIDLESEEDYNMNESTIEFLEQLEINYNLGGSDKRITINGCN